MQCEHREAERRQVQIGSTTRRPREEECRLAGVQGRQVKEGAGRCKCIEAEGRTAQHGA